MGALMLAGGHVATIRPRSDGSYSVTVRHPDGRSRGFALVASREMLGHHLMLANRECAKPFPHPAPAWFGAEAGGRDTATYRPGSRYDDPCGKVPKPTFTGEHLFDLAPFTAPWDDDEVAWWNEADMDAYGSQACAGCGEHRDYCACRVAPLYVGGRMVA